MNDCVRCGDALGIGRFCINCGHPVSEPAPPPDDWRSTTAERKAGPAAPPTEVARPLPAPPTAPPAAYSAPPPIRFPLYADEVGAPAEPTVLGSSEPIWAGASAPSQPYLQPHGRPAGRRVLPWVAVGSALLLVALAALGVFLVVGGDDPETATNPPPATSSATDPASDPGSSTSDSATSPNPPPETGTAEPSDPQDVASLATAIPPATAAPSRDGNGNAVRYDAANMLDGQPDTAWRMPGSGAGLEIAYVLESAVNLDEVGLINGYAKSYPGYDGYTANRRISIVEWILDDGTTVRQRLDDSRTLQTVPVDAGVTKTVTLRILKVTKPGAPPAGRDFTAISDVTLIGTPA